MADTVFRTKQIQEPSANEQAEIEKGENVIVPERKSEELSPLLWAETNQKPYLARMAGIEDVYDDLAPEIKVAAEEVEDYFKELVRRGKRSNTKTSYKDMILYLEKIVDVKNQPLMIKLNKIADFIKTLRRAKEYGIYKKP